MQFKVEGLENVAGAPARDAGCEVGSRGLEISKGDGGKSGKEGGEGTS